MAWDITQPTDSTKIRNLGIVIRPNWVAIQDAESTFKPKAINFTDRTVAGVSNDPTAIADAYITYCKTDTLGASELFGIDEGSRVLQFSTAGRLGGPTTNITFVNFKFGTDSTTYTRNNIIIAAGRFSSNGGTVSAYNCSISQLSQGLYEITLSPTALNTLFVPVATAQDEGNARICKINITSASTFTIHIVNEDGSNRDCGAYFMVCGGF